MSDSKKLLHERIRGGGWKSLSDITSEQLADEIERCYIPKPRFEDGEPVRIGDDVRVTCPDGDFEGPLYGVSYYADEIVLCNDDGDIVRINYGQRIGRLDAKKRVFDADGVMCVRGEDVWCITTGGSCRIERIDPGTRMCLVEWNSKETITLSWLDADCIAHRKPTFDADGVVIREGDTVWRCDSGEEFTVDKVDDSGGVVRVWHYRNGDKTFSYPSNLTHKPESLESLLGYVRKVNDSEVDADRSAEYCLMKIEARLDNLVKQSGK